MNIFAFTFTPVIAAAVTFIVYVASHVAWSCSCARSRGCLAPLLSSTHSYAALGNELTASTVFPAVAYLSLIRLPMQLMPIGGSIIIDMRVRTTWPGFCMWQYQHIAVPGSSSSYRQVFDAAREAAHPAAGSERQGRCGGVAGIVHVGTSDVATACHCKRNRAAACVPVEEHQLACRTW